MEIPNIKYLKIDGLLMPLNKTGQLYNIHVCIRSIIKMTEKTSYHRMKLIRLWQ